MQQRDLTVGDVVIGIVEQQFEWGYLIRLPSGQSGRLLLRELTWVRPRDGHVPAPLQLQTELYLKIIGATPKKNSPGQYILFSARALVPNPWQLTEQLYPVGTRISAPVSGFLTHGAYLNLPGGLSIPIHNSEVSWKDSNATAEMFFHIGQIIEVVVIESSGFPKRLSGSHRLAITDPWPDFAASAPAGTVFHGTVSSIVEYGAFVRLDNGFVGLLHKSQTGNRSCFSVNDRVVVSVASIDAKARRISLSVSPSIT